MTKQWAIFRELGNGIAPDRSGSKLLLNPDPIRSGFRSRSRLFMTKKFFCSKTVLKISHYETGFRLQEKLPAQQRTLQTFNFFNFFSVFVGDNFGWPIWIRIRKTLPWTTTSCMAGLGELYLIWVGKFVTTNISQVNHISKPTSWVLGFSGFLPGILHPPVEGIS